MLTKIIKDNKYLALITIVVLVLAVWGLAFSIEPLYSIEDFQNGTRVFYNPNLPREELDLRLEDLKASEVPRDGEDPSEASLDAFRDYYQAGLYGEAWRVSQEIDSKFKDVVDSQYLETKGDLLVSMRQYSDAVDSYAKALDKNKKQASVYGKLADLYLYWSNLEEKKEIALELYEKSLANNPESTRHKALQRQIDALKNSL